MPRPPAILQVLPALESGGVDHDVDRPAQGRHRLGMQAGRIRLEIGGDEGGPALAARIDGLGGGLEAALTDNLIVRAEYLFTRFNDVEGITTSLNQARVGAALKF